MRFSHIAAILFLASCTSSEKRQQEHWMDLVEERVQLPEGASALDAYARYYAKDDEGRVRAVYTTFIEPKLEYYNVPAGERRWVENYKNLPLIHDGGCGVVTFAFNPSLEKIDPPVCNFAA